MTEMTKSSLNLKKTSSPTACWTYLKIESKTARKGSKEGGAPEVFRMPLFIDV
jgi:hypothetical protein